MCIEHSGPFELSAGPWVHAIRGPCANIITTSVHTFGGIEESPIITVKEAPVCLIPADELAGVLGFPGTVHAAGTTQSFQQVTQLFFDGNGGEARKVRLTSTRKGPDELPSTGSK